VKLRRLRARQRGRRRAHPHPIRTVQHEVEHLREVAEAGESEATPAILIGRILTIVLPVAALMLGVTVGISMLVTRGDGTPAAPWALANGDLANTRVTHGSSISSDDVSELGVAWTTPLTASSIYGTFAANPVIANGVVYLQDLDSNVWATNLASGRVLWRRNYDQKSIGPNGVSYVDGVVYGAATKFAFALDAKTGRELWRNTTLVPATRQKGGGEFASGFGIDIQPQVSDGKVYLSTAALLGGGIAYALDAHTGKTLWSFDTVPDPVANKVIAGGAWNPSAIAPNGEVYFGLGNMYQPYAIAVARPGRRLYVDSTVALDGSTGRLRWYYQAVPDDFHDWDMQLSPVWTQVDGRDVVLDAGKMGYVYEFDAKTGKLLWKTKVGVHNGHDDDNLLALRHKLKLRFPLTVEPGIVGGVETNMAVADGVAYVPVADLASTYAKPTTGLGAAAFGDGKGELLALDVKTGKILWDTKLSQMADGDATVVNDLVFTTTFDGHLLALDRKSGKILWDEKLPAFTNAPVAISGDTLVTAASYPAGKGQTPEVIAFKLGAHGSFKPTASAAGAGSVGATDGKALFSDNCSSCHTLAAAHAKGAVGPNLDQLKPTAASVRRQVTNGGGGMPSFGGRLSKAQIDAIAKYVATHAGK
jgi:outer membrane protein assembly factor BamB